MENKFDLLSLSRLVSYILRHEPDLYELELDEEGWVISNDLIDALKKSDNKWDSLSLTDLKLMIDQSEKKRHEIKGSKIRALYGHSVSTKLKKELREPPEFLYHGTTPAVIDKIKSFGLLPMSRQYIHLSVSLAMAEEVGKRKSSHPIILFINAKTAFANGIKFYYGNELVWLADFIPASYINFERK